MKISDNQKHLIVSSICSALASIFIALLVWASLIVHSNEVLMHHLLAPIWFAGVASALAMGIGKEYGDECAEGNEWSWGDVLYDIFGAILGATIVCLTINFL
jgi:hypothetical protein